MIGIEIKLNLEPLQRFLTALIRFAGAVGFDAETDRLYRQWAVRYRSWALERFDTFTKGGGDWAPLAPATLARKRGIAKRTNPGGTVRRNSGGGFSRVASGGAVAILVDKGTMKAALSPAFTNRPGQLQEMIPGGVRVGYGGSGRSGDSTLTVAQIAEVHHFGKGRVPRREIIVEPDEKVKVQMALDVERAVERLVERARARG